MTAGGYESSVTGAVTPYQGFTARLRARETLIGYWIALDSPVSTERIGGSASTTWLSTRSTGCWATTACSAA